MEEMMLSLWNNFGFDHPRRFSNRGLFDSMVADSFGSSTHWGVEYKKAEDGTLEVAIDVPGIEEKDIVVEVSDQNVLQVRGERKTKTSTYTVNKSFSIPEEYDTVNIKAELKNGVLTVTLPTVPVKAKETKKVTVTVAK
jgi:HSP20 family molecular chaperone IbpA